MEWKVKGDLVTKTVGQNVNVVSQVNWVCIAQSGEVTINMNGTTDLDYDPSNPFIQYRDLTEAQVIGWVKSVIGQDAVAFYEQKAQELLDVELNDEERTGSVFECWSKYEPKQNQPAPWA